MKPRSGELHVLYENSYLSPFAGHIFRQVFRYCAVTSGETPLADGGVGDETHLNRWTVGFIDKRELHGVTQTSDGIGLSINELFRDDRIIQDLYAFLLSEYLRHTSHNALHCAAINPFRTSS